MNKKKLYLLLPILILIFFFAISGECKGSAREKAKDAVEEVGRSAQKAVEEVEEAIKDDEVKQEEISVAEDKDKDDKGSSQSEDVQDLNKQDRSGSVTLNGKVECRNEISNIEWTAITITIDWDKKSVGGNTSLIWYEYIEVSGESGEAHHTHKYVCRVEFNSIILGTIDKDDNVKATISGNTSCDYGYNPKSVEPSLEICDLCEKNLNNKFKTFTLIGKYRISSTGVVETVKGNIAENGWKWETIR